MSEAEQRNFKLTAQKKFHDAEFTKTQKTLDNRSDDAFDLRNLEKL